MGPGVIGRETFVPALAYISAITNAQNAVVTFTAAHDYSPGELISFRVSKPYGMYEINQKVGKVLLATTNAVTVNIDTTGFTVFVYPVSGKNTPPVTVAAGSDVIPGVYPSTMNLQDTYDCLRPS